MYKIIGGDNEEYGPVEADQIKEWILDGRVDTETKVWSEKDSQWHKAGELEEFAGEFEKDDSGFVDLEKNSVEVKASASVGDAENYNKDYQIDLANLVKSACGILFSSAGNYWSSVLAIMILSGVGYGIGLICEMISMPLTSMLGLGKGMMPQESVQAIANAWRSSSSHNLIILLSVLFILAELIAIGINGILTGGILKFFISLKRGNPPEMVHCFAGFGKKWKALFAAPFVVFILIALSMIPLIACIIGMLFLGKGMAGHDFVWDGRTINFLVMVLLAVVSLIPIIFTSICAYFTVPLIIDREIGCIEAIKLSAKVASTRWLLILLACIVFGVLSILGFILLFIGVFLTLPIGYMGMAYLYDEFFGKKSE